MALDNSIGFNEITITETSQDNDELLIHQGDYTKRITKEHLFPVTGTVEAGNNYPVTSAGVDTAIKAKDAENIKKTAQTLTEAEKLQARTNIGAAEDNAQYKAGDEVPIRFVVSNGYITSSQSNIHFDLILKKEVPSDLKVSLSGNVSIRENGYYLMPEKNMAGSNFGFEVSESSITQNSYVSTNGVKIVLAVPAWYRQNSTTVAENNFPVSVNITSGTLTFS